METDLESIVAAVISRLAHMLGADGRRGKLITVLCGATACFTEAVSQVRALVLDGYQIDLCFSPAAEELYGKVFRNQLAGFPHIQPLGGKNWLEALNEARAVVVPLLSVNTVSKISMLIADNTATNLIVHALFMGKPVIVARNGADPNEKARQVLGFDRGKDTLKKALTDRLRVLESFGCVLTDASELRKALIWNLEGNGTEFRSDAYPSGGVVQPEGMNRKVVSSTDVLQAYYHGVDIVVSRSSIVTPLAREIARRHGVGLKEQG